MDDEIVDMVPDGIGAGEKVDGVIHHLGAELFEAVPVFGNEVGADSRLGAGMNVSFEHATGQGETGGRTHCATSH